MSAFFVAINRDGSDFDSAVARSMQSQIDCFGNDGSELIVRDNFALGYQRHWMVPEEIDEHQPLFDQMHNSYFLFHGRVDNRNELMGLLSTTVSEHISDAELLHSLLLESKVEHLSRIKGPFVYVLFDVANKKILAARDSMGGRHLTYFIDDDVLILTTYEMAAVAHPKVDYQINQQKWVRWISYQSEQQPESFIRSLEVLLPGELLTIESKAYNCSKFYIPDPDKRVRFSSKSEYAKHFHKLLTQAVARRLRSIKPVASMLSGGMDSVPISIVAAQLLATDKQRLKSFSWVFDKYSNCDERVFSEGVCEDFDIDPHWINCDSVWPAFDSTTHVDPVIPLGTEYSEFNQVLLSAAQKSNVGVMLSGIGGDLLYSGTGGILIELILAGQWRDFSKEFGYLWARSPNKLRFCRNLIVVPLVKRIFGHRWRSRVSLPGYLTSEAKHLLKSQPGWLAKIGAKSLRPQQYSNLLDGFEGDDAHFGRRMEAKFALEKRYPLRDRDLVEFMLAIPVTELYSCGVTRPIVKAAFRREFRKELHDRQTKTDFTPVVSEGVRRDKQYPAWLKHQNRDWPDFVKESYISGSLDTDAAANRLRWQLAYYEFWKVVCYNFFLKNLGDTDGRVDEK